MEAGCPNFHNNLDDEQDKNDVDTMLTQCRPHCDVNHLNKIEAVRNDLNSMSAKFAWLTMSTMLTTYKIDDVDSMLTNIAISTI